jgi:hypothetical protein
MLALLGGERGRLGDDPRNAVRSQRMNVTWPVALAVLFGALLHAGWNALVKSAADKALDTALLNLIGAVFALPLLLAAGLPAASAGSCWRWPTQE